MSAHDDNRPEDFPPDLKPFEAVLAGLIPAGSRIDRDRLMYSAGAAAATGSTNSPVAHASRPPKGLWPAATAALLLVSLGLAALLAFRQPREQIVYVDRPAANHLQVHAAQIADIGPEVPSPATSASASYLVLREQVLRLGVDALDPPRRAGGTTDYNDVRNRALLNQLLGS